MHAHAEIRACCAHAFFVCYSFQALLNIASWLMYAQEFLPPGLWHNANKMGAISLISIESIYMYARCSKMAEAKKIVSRPG